MKISQNFCSEEFLPKDMHDDLVASGRDPKWFIRKNIVDFCEWLRAKFPGKELIINNWKWGGPYQESGLRSINTTTGAKYSQHKFGNAIDIKIKGLVPGDIRKVIVDNFKYLKETYGLTTIEKIEDTPTWLHCDFRWTGKEELLEVNGK